MILFLTKLENKSQQSSSKSGCGFLWFRSGCGVQWFRSGCGVLWFRSGCGVQWFQSGCRVLWFRSGCSRSLTDEWTRPYKVLNGRTRTLNWILNLTRSPWTDNRTHGRASGRFWQLHSGPPVSSSEKFCSDSKKGIPLIRTG